MALGCIPSHACYFLAYEHLKNYFDVNYGEFNVVSNLCIGATTTFAHDFFITPSDGKFLSFFLTFKSNQTKASIVQHTYSTTGI
jgi:hypothetical protein